MRLSRYDIVVTGTLLSIIVIFSYLTCEHFDQRVTQRVNSQSIGNVRYKYNQVKRKFTGRFIWGNVSSFTPVYLNDSILTGDHSDAVIELDSGLKIELDPNSLVTLDIIEDSIGLKLERGLIRAKGGKAGDPIFIETSSGLRADIQGSHVTLSEDEGTSGIFVKSGSIKIDGRETLVSGKVLQLNKNGKWILKEIHIVNLKPTDGALTLTKKNKKKITFRWDSTKSSDAYDLYLSRNRSMKNVKKIKVQTKQYRTTLAAGNWYWQVRSRRQPDSVFSNIQSLNIQKFKPLDILSPADDTLLISKPKDSIVFRWKLSSENSSVRFSLASDKLFKNKIKEEVVVAPSIVVKGLKKGKYYWKVRPEFGKKVTLDTEIFDGDNEANESNLDKKYDKVIKKHIFVVDDTQKKLEYPKNLKPSFNFSIPAGKTKNIRFSWDIVTGADSYEVEVSLSGKKRSTLKKRVRTNYYIVPISWQTKEVSWSVRAIKKSQGTKLILRSKKSVVRLDLRFSIPPPPKVISAYSKIIY